ncbi:MAG: hypothetical protein ACMUJM_21435 [bacterium]
MIFVKSPWRDTHNVSIMKVRGDGKKDERRIIYGQIAEATAFVKIIFLTIYQS